MAKLDFYFDTKKVNEDIANWRDLEIEVSFEDESGHVKSSDLEFTGDLAQKINQWNANGLTGGYGILEAPPFRIEVCGSNQSIFDGGINTADCPVEYSCDKIVAPLREGARMDDFNERSNSFSFAYLASLPPGASGRIAQSDYVLVPYVVSTVPDWMSIITGIISLYIMIKELEQAIEKTSAAVAELTGDIIPTAGTGTSVTVGAVIADLVKVVLYLAYLAIMTIAIIDLTMMVFNSLIQPVKYKKGIRVTTLVQRACEYLGYNYSSTLLQKGVYKDLVLIPRKNALSTNTSITQGFVSKLTGLSFNMKQNDDAKNINTTGFFEGTFGQLLLGLNDVFNSKQFIIKNTAGASFFYYERIDYFQTQSAYTLPNVSMDPHGTNACELAANYYLKFALDDVDTNTYDLFDGTEAQHINTPIVVKNKGNVLLSKIDERALLFARAKVKLRNSAIEDIFNVIYNVARTTYTVFKTFVNVTVGTMLVSIKPLLFLLNKLGVPPISLPTLPTFPPNPVGNRISMMMLSSDFIGVQKLLIVSSSNRISVLNETYTSAGFLLDNYHYINFIYTTNDIKGGGRLHHNQWLTYKNKEIPLCCSAYVEILNNAFIKTYDGKVAKIDSIIWNPYKETAKISYRVKELWTKNIQEKYITI